MIEQRRAGEAPSAGHPVEEPFRKGQLLAVRRSENDPWRVRRAAWFLRRDQWRGHYGAGPAAGTGFATSWRFAKAAEEVWPDGAPASAMDNSGRLDLAHG